MKRIYAEGELKGVYFALLSRNHRPPGLWHRLVAANEARRFASMLLLIEALRGDKAFEAAYLRRMAK